MDTNVSKNVHKGGSHPVPEDKHSHQPQRKKRLRPAAEAMKKRIVTSRLDDIRLILESAATNDELALKINGVKVELRAVEEAMDHGGPSYLGIVDKGELEKRKKVLERKCRLLEEERELVQALRVEAAEEERAAAPRTEIQVASSPLQRRNSGSKDKASAAAGARAGVAAPQSPPSIRAPAPAPSSPPAAMKGAYAFAFTPPPGKRREADSSVGDFLKKNTALMGKKLAAAKADGD